MPFLKKIKTKKKLMKWVRCSYDLIQSYELNNHKGEDSFRD